MYIVLYCSPPQVRWEESVRLLDFKLKGLVGNTLVSAGMVAYVGPFTSAYRQDLASDWLRRCHEKAIPISDDYEFVPNLVDANQVKITYCQYRRHRFHTLLGQM